MKHLLRYLLILVPLAFVACDDGDDDGNITPPPPPPNLEGMFVYGSNTVADSPEDMEARMSLAVLDPKQGSKTPNSPGIFGKLMYIGANSTINFTEGTEESVIEYGAEGGGTLDSASVAGNVLVKDKVIFGTLVEDGEAIKVADEGLYYVYVDASSKSFVLMKVKAQLIGDATTPHYPTGTNIWGIGTPLALKSISKDSTVFEATGIALKKDGGYRYRLNDGWHVYADPNIVTMSSLGVQEAWVDAYAKEENDLGFFIENAPHKEDGVYTIRLKYNADTDTWTEKKIRTGDIVVTTPTDYSEHNIAIIGDATDGGSWNGDGTGGHGGHTPSKVGHVYTWVYNDVEFIEGKEFIFLQDATWGKFQIDYSQATVNGTAIEQEKIIDATAEPVAGPYHNFHVLEGGVYDVRIVIDASTGQKTITIDVNDQSSYTDYSDYSIQIIGNATENGSWNGDGTGGFGAQTPTKDGNVYTWTWTVDFITDREFIFLRDASWGQFQIDYAQATTVNGSAIDDGNIIDATAPPVNGPYHNFYVITGGTYEITLVIDAATESKVITINNN